MNHNLLTFLALHLGLASGVAQPVITNQPTWQTNFIGGTATFTVGATGAPPLSYQWRSHATLISYTNIPFGTEATLVLTNVQPTQRRFAVVVTDAGGLSATSSPLVSLTVVTPPSITPANPTASLFADVTLFATNGSGAARSSYQWLLNGEPIAGAVTNRLVVTNVQPTNAGAAYSIVVTYSFGSVTSQVATLTITPFTITPADPTASLFADVTLLFTNSSGPPLSYQWLFNGEPLAGAVTKELVVTNVQKTNAGDYATVVTYAFGSVTSQVATLKIVPFNSIYCFGYSWTDTHNCVWDPTMWYHSRACNGPMWPEFLSTNLGLAYVESNNYAVCGAGPLDVLNQVSLNLRVPPKPELSLFCLMFSDDILAAAPGFPCCPYIDVTNTLAWDQIIQTGVSSNSNAIRELYALGARTIVVQGEIDARHFPGVLERLSMDELRLSKVSEYCQRYNAGFYDAVNAIAKARPDLHLIWVDLFSKLNEVVANPQGYGFTKANIDALHDPAIADRSFSGPGADYVFWDALHGTSKLNALESRWTFEALTNAAPETLEAHTAAGSLALQMNHLLIGRDYTLQSSADLLSWNDVLTLTASAGTNQVSQALETGTRSAFYKLQWQP